MQAEHDEITYPNLDLESKSKQERVSGFYVDLAGLCVDVYRESGRPSLPDGWQIFADYSPLVNTTGYFASCYYTTMTGRDGIPVKVGVFAHRGTVLEVNRWTGLDPISIFNLISDYKIFTHEVPIQYKEAVEFVRATKEKFIAQVCKPGEPAGFYHTGHSLGAVISDLVIVTSDPKNPVNESYSFTFENPGSAPIIANMMATGELPSNALQLFKGWSQAFQADVNFINTCNEQAAGGVFRLSNLGYHISLAPGLLSSPDLIPVNPAMNINYLTYTMEQHSMANIYDYLRRDGRIETSTVNPVGIKAGYTAYLNPARQAYWQNFAQTYWDGNMMDHPLYHNNFQEFLGHFNRTLTEVWQESSVEKLQFNSSYNQHGFLGHKQQDNIKNTQVGNAELKSKLLINESYSDRGDEHGNQACSPCVIL